MFLLGILELKRDMGVITLPPENILCLQMSRCLSLLYFSPHHVTLFDTIPLPLSAPASADSSPVPLVDTSEPSASKSVRDFTYVYTNRQKVHAAEPALADPSLVDDPPQPSASPSELDIIIALHKGKWSCTNHLIS